MQKLNKNLISSVIAVYLTFGLYTPVGIADTTVIDDNDSWSLHARKIPLALVVFRRWLSQLGR